MGAGKTTVGRALARRLGWMFEDLDDRIELLEGRSIAEIFETSGEAEFRRIESEALRLLLNEPGSHRIVALGGGAFAQAENADLLREAGVPIVFLDGPADELLRRCEGESRKRPLRASAKEFRQLYERRRPFYLQAAWRIDTNGKDQETIAAEVVCRLGLE